MLSRLDRSEMRFRAAHIVKCPDRSAIVYPDGVLGRGKYLTTSQLTAYLAERDQRLQRFIKFQNQYRLLTWLLLFIILFSLVLSSNKGVILVTVLAAIPLLVVALFWTRYRTVKLFARLFPQAPHATDTGRYQRWILVMLISSEFSLWRCSIIMAVFLVILASSILALCVGGTPQEVMIALLSGGFSIGLLGFYGHLLFHHAKFRLCHHRCPHEVDIKSLQTKCIY